MNNSSFPICVFCDFKKILLIVEPLNNDLYKVSFPDGKTIMVNTNEPKNVNQTRWSIEGQGETELAKEIGAAIDHHNYKEGRYYMEPFVVTIDDEDYLIDCELDKEDDTERFDYAVYKDGRFWFYIEKQDGEEGTDDDYWVSDFRGANPVSPAAIPDQDLIQQIGEAIEQH